MAGASTRRDLFLQVSGTVNPLRQALQVGKTSLVEFAGDAAKQLEAVEKALQDLGGANAAQNAKRMTDSYAAAFKDIRRNAQEVLNAPSGAGAVSIINANSAREAASAAESQAASLRKVAEAAKAAALEQGNENAQLVQYAAAAAVNARVADDYASRLREQANVLGLVESKLAGHVVAGRKTVEMTGQQRAGVQQLMYNLNDAATQWSLNASAEQIFASQGSQVIQALMLIVGETKAASGAMGLWIPVIGGVLAIAAPLVATLFEGADGSDEMAKKGLTLVDALSLEKFGTEAATKALKDYNSEKDRARKKDEEATQAALDLARARLNDALATREKIKAELELANSSAESGLAGSAAAEKLAAQNKLIAETRTAINNISIDLATKNAVDRNDKAEIARRYYESQKQAALAAAAAEEKAGRTVDQKALERKLSDIETEKAAKLKSIRETDAAEKKVAKENREFGRRVSSAEARSIAEKAGFQVNSSNRSTARQQQLYDAWVAAGKPADNPVAKPGTSAHERGNALDIQISPGVTVAAIRKAFEDEGVRLTKIFKERGHYHVEWAPQGRARTGSTPEERAEAKEKNRRDAFESQLARAQDDYLAAQQALTSGTEETADAQYARLRAATLAREEDLDRQQAAGKLKEAEAEQLRVLNQSTYDAKKTAIARAEESRLVREQAELEQQRLDTAIGMLNLQGELATTFGARRRIALQILALEEEERRKAAERVVKDPKSTLSEKGQALGRIAQIDIEHPLRKEQIERRDADPLQSWFQGLKDSVGDGEHLRATLEGITVDGLDRGVDAIGNMVAGALKLKGIAGEIVAEFAKMLIKKAALEVGTKLFHFSGGTVPGYADGYIDPTGTIRGPGTGTSDSIFAWMTGRGPIMVSNQESIMTAAATRRYGPMLKAMNAGRLPGYATGVIPGGIMPRLPDMRALTPEALAPPGARAAAVELRGKIKVEPSPLFDARMEEVSARTVGAAAEPIMAGAEARTVKRIARPRLPGGYG